MRSSSCSGVYNVPIGEIRIPHPFVKADFVTSEGSFPSLTKVRAALLLGPKILLVHALTRSAHCIICLTSTFVFGCQSVSIRASRIANA